MLGHHISGGNPAKLGLLPHPESIEWAETGVSLNEVKFVLPKISGEKLRVAQIKSEFGAI